MDNENKVLVEPEVEVAYRRVYGRDEWKFTNFKTWRLYNQATGLEVLTPAWFGFIEQLGIRLVVNEDAEFPDYKVVKS